jgi:hypothetical protein
MPAAKPTLVVDTECFPDYFLVMFKSVEKGTVRHYEMYPGHPLDRGVVEHILHHYRIVSFNGLDYDMPMLTLALSGASNAKLKEASDWIIAGNNRGWQFYDHYDLYQMGDVDHIDIIEVAVGQGSLKLYGGRLHSQRLQDLPIEPDAHITPEQRVELRRYCENDLETTLDLWNSLSEQIALRERMTDQYGIDLRSKSDAQIAEAVIKHEISRALGRRVGRPTIPPGTTFRYLPPSFLRFRTAQLQTKLVEIAAASFVVGLNGSPIEPAALKGQVISIGSGRYRLGVGGLHSSEERVAHHADDQTILMDVDVSSYYPSIILRCGLYPEHLTEKFLHVYRDIVEGRLRAKALAGKLKARLAELEQELRDASAE